ncbi:E7 [Trichechus manatus latirostris papillomavirus 4]|uniref:Protein E7 n=1 Tax=Trichechus manatus latirostris papillomavirus 4 TaxID=2848317 RepID=A0A0F6TNI9_9PAPI|nr:E7 [Trichechus manatus latirostris papillomavirus 4]AKE50903.1 E7 [Trichechus manatus latirostris papillomavirus 4]
MHGVTATLQDIVLYEYPEPHRPVDLHCDEEVAYSDLDEEEESVSVLQTPYRVLVECGFCRRPVRIVVVSTGGGIHRLHQLLLENLQLICPVCARERTL